jgi:hypothetical protein
MIISSWAPDEATINITSGISIRGITAGIWPQIRNFWYGNSTRTPHPWAQIFSLQKNKGITLETPLIQLQGYQWDNKQAHEYNFSSPHYFDKYIGCVQKLMSLHMPTCDRLLLWDHQFLRDLQFVHTHRRPVQKTTTVMVSSCMCASSLYFLVTVRACIQPAYPVFAKACAVVV